MSKPRIIRRHGAGGNGVLFDTATGKRVDAEPPKEDSSTVFTPVELEELAQELLDLESSDV